MKYFLSGLFLVAILTVGWLIQSKYINLDTLFPTKSYTIFNDCNNKMKHNACVIMNTNANFSNEVQQIFIPEIGPIDANIYRDLLKSGMGMCQVIRDSCETDLKSAVCQIGNTLYSVKK